MTLPQRKKLALDATQFTINKKINKVTNINLQQVPIPVNPENFVHKLLAAHNSQKILCHSG